MRRGRREHQPWGTSQQRLMCSLCLAVPLSLLLFSFDELSSRALLVWRGPTLSFQPQAVAPEEEKGQAGAAAAPPIPKSLRVSPAGPSLVEEEEEGPPSSYVSPVGLLAVPWSGWEGEECYEGADAGPLCEQTGFCPFASARGRNCTTWARGRFKGPDMPPALVPPHAHTCGRTVHCQHVMGQGGHWTAEGEGRARRVAWQAGQQEEDRELPPSWYYRSELLSQLSGQSVAVVGDSLSRQVFNRLLHWCRGLLPVLDHYYHLNAIYRFNHTHDSLTTYYGLDSQPPQPPEAGSVTVHYFFVHPGMLASAKERQALLHYISQTRPRAVAVGSGYWAGFDPQASAAMLEELLRVVGEVAGGDGRVVLVTYPRDRQREAHDFMGQWRDAIKDTEQRDRVSVVDMEGMWVGSTHGPRLIYRNQYESKPDSGEVQWRVPFPVPAGGGEEWYPDPHFQCGLTPWLPVAPTGYKTPPMGADCSDPLNLNVVQLILARWLDHR